MTKITLTQCDTRHVFTSDLRWPDGSPVNLNGTTIKFLFRRFDATWLYERDVATPGSGSVVSYQPVAADVAQTGLFWQTWRVTFNDGKIQTFPNDGPNVVELLKALA